MKLGEVASIRCSPDYAYGAGGFPGVTYFQIEPRAFQIDSMMDF